MKAKCKWCNWIVDVIQIIKGGYGTKLVIGSDRQAHEIVHLHDEKDKDDGQ